MEQLNYTYIFYLNLINKNNQISVNIILCIPISNSMCTALFHPLFSYLF